MPASILETTIDITLGNFFAVISTLVGFTCCLLAVFLFAVPSARRLPNRLLAVFLVLTAIELSAWLWVTPGNAGEWLNALRLALGKLQMPIFFGFFVATCYSDFRPRWRDTLHLVPFMVALAMTLPGSQVPFASGSTALHLTELESHVFWIASHVQYYAYMVAVIMVLVQFRRLFHAHHSGDRSEVLTWLTQLAAVSLFAHTLILVRNVLLFTSATDVVLALQVIGILLALAITSWIALKSLLQPHLFRDVDRRLIALTGGADQVHQKAEVPSPQLERLHAFMDADEPYLDPGLTLASLSAQVAMTPRDLSELLNRSLGVHFFDFINGYRIEKAQHLLLAEPRQSVLQILYAVGFNSKSSFNTAFKKHSGVTPSAFRAQQPAAPGPYAKAPQAFDF
ncbi:helix-turn-helix domain-containing protein [Wenzhouxiangella sp. XN24]|uniref:helix-turn-helix domain-containing protein n=1 Tax=Wenzhouxiangella sp. XN24 TaxID=2713569 RepID=UPI0013EA7D18|nr:helix-turn-helix domain-containing protein [Wenzhouxiangella sp. XN24]NGX17145.1 AraC family transcriptional regulator [Wenzhouxiangella sp. XN24]